MMADLIRTSMFCDVNDVFANNEHRFLADIERTCYNDNLPYNTSSYCDNFLEFMARTSDNVDEVSSAHEISMTHLPQQQTLQQTTSDIENDVTIIDQQTTSTSRSCNGSVATEEICQDFLSRIVQASKVDFSTFNNVAPSIIFSNDYLHPIVFERETNPPVKQTPINDSKPVKTSVRVTRPPYSYAACAVAAIYLAGKDCLSAQEIMDKLCSVFEDVRSCRSQFRKHLSKTLKTNKLFKQVDGDMYEVVPGRVHRNVFHRQLSVNPERREKYADMIHTHLEIPTMLEHFGIELSSTEKCRHRKRGRVVSDLLKDRKSSASVKEQLQSVKCVNEELEMPRRHCFRGNRDNQDDEMLTHPLGRNISPVSIESSQNSASVCNDESRSSFQENVDSEQFSRCDNVSHPAIHHAPSVVVPVPRYAVPTPSACVPLRCQEYHIPYVGTFQLVDMYYNGQIIHQLYS